MSLDTLPVVAQELQKYQGLREFFSTSEASPSIQYSASSTTSSNTIGSCDLSFSVKAEQMTFLLPWCCYLPQFSNIPKKSPYYLLCLLMEHK